MAAAAAAAAVQAATATPLRELRPEAVPWPLHTPLAGSEFGSFAHGTITQRLPAIVAGMLNDMEGLAARSKDADWARQMRAAATEIQAMRQELLAADTALPADLVAPATATPALQASVASTNQALAAWRARQQSQSSPSSSASSSSAPRVGQPSSWLALPWLLVECYMYVRIAVAIQRQPALVASRFDPFHVQKLAGFNKSRASIASMAASVLDLVALPALKRDASTGRYDATSSAYRDAKAGLYCAVQYALWGNKTDLSLLVDASKIDPAALAAPATGAGSPFLLVDEFEAAWEVLVGGTSGTRRVDIVLDNSGLELYSDLCLADVLIQYGLADEVVLHGKPFGWFVSDTIQDDLTEILKLCGSPCEPSSAADPSAWSKVQALTQRWDKHLAEGRWRYVDHPFWVTPAPFSWMSEVAPELYSELRGSSTLVVFKGDLNYRKLTSDCRWPWTKPFKESLQGFLPAPIVSLRTLKADVIAGLKPGEGEAVAKIDKDWQVNGKFGVIQTVV